MNVPGVGRQFPVILKVCLSVQGFNWWNLYYFDKPWTAAVQLDFTRICSAIIFPHIVIWRDILVWFYLLTYEIKVCAVLCIIWIFVLIFSDIKKKWFSWAKILLFHDLPRMISFPTYTLNHIKLLSYLVSFGNIWGKLEKDIWKMIISKYSLEGIV